MYIFCTAPIVGVMNDYKIPCAFYYQLSPIIFNKQHQLQLTIKPSRQSFKGLHKILRDTEIVIIITNVWESRG